MNLSYENNGAPFGSLIDLTHSESLFLAPVVKWNIDGATWVKAEAQYNYNPSSLYTPFDPLYNGAFVNVPRNTNYGESNAGTQTNLFAALTWSHQFNSDWSIKQQLAYNSIEVNTPDVLPSGLCTVVSGTCYSFGFPVGSIGVPTPSSGFAVERFPGVIQTPQNTVSTNVDITGHFNTFGAQHTLLIGGDIYYLYGSFLDSIYGDTSLIDLFDPIHPGTPFGCFTAPCSSFATAFTQETAGLYAQDQIKLPFNIYLLAGARYQYIHQTGSQSFAFEGSDSVTVNQPLEGQAVTPRFGLLWRPQDWISFYGNYAQSYGPNSGLVPPGALAPPTNANSWEGGAKLEFFDGKLRVSADYFELVKTNVPVGDPENPLFVLLAGEARSKGPELDIQGEILPGWKVIANYTNDDVRITEGNNMPGGALQTEALVPGQRFPGVPRNQANFWTTYEFQDETLKGFKIGAGYHYVGSTTVFGETPAQPFPLVPSYGTVDLMAAYKFKLAAADVTAQLNITNLFNTTYYTAASIGTPANVVPGFSPGPTYRAYGAPFAAVGSLRAQF